MKKIGFVLVIAFLAIGTVSAQGWGGVWGAPSQTTSVTGTLQLQNGEIAVASGNTIYFVPTLTRYIGFIEGLREGAQISMDGFVSGNYFQPNRVTISGKTYDFTSNVSQGTAYGGYGWCHNGMGYVRSIGYGGGWGRGGCW